VKCRLKLHTDITLHYITYLLAPRLPVVQSQAAEEHDTWQHAFSDTGSNADVKARLQRTCCIAMPCEQTLINVMLSLVCDTELQNVIWPAWLLRTGSTARCVFCFCFLFLTIPVVPLISKSVDDQYEISYLTHQWHRRNRTIRTAGRVPSNFGDYGD